MSQYTSKDGQFYKVIDKNSGEFITAGELEEGIELVTIHIVEFIDQVEYESLIVGDTHYS
ncbi:hypothetical protein [Acinetobacter sp. YH12103]|uniref:hypothetical protein n=1 Tax=Acinetobacter sp. YH12103 TaxID=2601092 RepID=UPI0015D29707|nr:hypothetical protein [Acinetobacter sp. YH12103]